jgi:hypothetical protein
MLFGSRVWQRWDRDAGAVFAGVLAVTKLSEHPGWVRRVADAMLPNASSTPRRVASACASAATSTRDRDPYLRAKR